MRLRYGVIALSQMVSVAFVRGIDEVWGINEKVF